MKTKNEEKPTITGQRKGKKTGGAKRWTANYRNKQEKPEMGTEQEQQSNINRETTTEKEETAETSKQRKEQANQALWKKIDTKTIKIGEHYRKMGKTMRNKLYGKLI